MRKLINIILICNLTHTVFSQTDSTAYVFQEAIENAVANNDDLAFDYNTEFEYLKDYLKNPLDINQATQADLEYLRLLSPKQVQDIMEHKAKNRGYITLYEFQSLLDLATLNRILPFVTIKDKSGLTQLPINQWFSRGKNELYLRAERRLEKADGFLRENTEGGYWGDANKLYTRYRYTFLKNVSYGFTLEKDVGEKSITDFYSFHFKISNFHSAIKTVCIGDYAISLGQGLILENGFAMGKSALVMNIEKTNLPIKPYTSANESNFMRGIATHFKINRNTEGVLFASFRQRDGNINNDTLLDKTTITSLQTSGLHRTTNEIMDKNATDLWTFGGRYIRSFRQGILAFNGVFNQFSKEINPKFEPYNLNYFRGKQLLNTSLDYKQTIQNFHFFGETAMSFNPFYENKLGLATLNGVLVGLDKRLSISILHRYFSTNYQAIQAQPFAETARTQDEQGIYWGLEFKPIKRLTFVGYADMWQHKWWRFRIDAPSQGADFLGKIAYRLRNTEGYAQVRYKTKMENAERSDSAKVNTVTPIHKTQIRLHFQQKISKQLQVRNRLEYAFYKKDKQRSKGFLIYQDILFDSEKYPLSITSRLAFFDTDDYQSAIYAYENDVLYNFTILPNYYSGSRFYINLSYKGVKNWLFEYRIARTQLSNRTAIGSGLDEIKGNHRTDMTCQVRFSF